MLSEPVARPSSVVPRIGTSQSNSKGKQKAPTVQIPRAPRDVPSPKPASAVVEAQRVPKAWWLDVSSPTWEDMCAIGKVGILLVLILHMHDADTCIHSYCIYIPLLSRISLLKTLERS